MMSETLLLSFLVVAMAVFAAVSYLSWKIFNNQKLKNEILSRMEEKLDSVLNEEKIKEEIIDKKVIPPKNPKEEENEW